MSRRAAAAQVHLEALGPRNRPAEISGMVPPFDCWITDNGWVSADDRRRSGWVRGGWPGIARPAVLVPLQPSRRRARRGRYRRRARRLRAERLERGPRLR